VISVDAESNRRSSTEYSSIRLVHLNVVDSDVAAPGWMSRLLAGLVINSPKAYL